MRGYSQEVADYPEALEMFNLTEKLLNKRQSLMLAAEREGGFQAIHASRN